jgi:hypothetical protein
LEALRGLSLAPCVGFDNYLLAYSGRSLVGLVGFTLPSSVLSRR